MRKNRLFVAIALCFILCLTTYCQKTKGLFGGKKSSSTTTGWKYNDSENGGFEYGNVSGQKAGPGLIFISGGTFVMGRTQEDVIGEWDNVPTRVSIASYYMDETEVRNCDWLEYLTWLQCVYVSYPAQLN